MGVGVDGGGAMVTPIGGERVEAVAAEAVRGKDCEDGGGVFFGEGVLSGQFGDG